MKATPSILSDYGVSVPRVLYGTAWKADRTAALVEQAITLGFWGLDTACQPKHYDEPGVGAGLAACLAAGRSRADLYLQSKFTPEDGQDPARMPYDPAASLSDQVAQSFVTSLKNLGTDYLDGLLLHSPLANAADLMQVWRALESIFAAGGARQLGISNCYTLAQLEHLYETARVKPAIVQNRFYAQTGYDHDLRAFCRKHRILYQSFWTLTANPQILAHPTVQRLAARFRHTPAQVWFRYLTQLDIIPLTGTTSAAHMREDLSIFELELAPSESDAIDQLLR